MNSVITDLALDLGQFALDDELETCLEPERKDHEPIHVA